MRSIYRKEQTTEGGGKSQLITFLLGGEIYGIDIFNIQEVLNLKRITYIPNAPEFVEGVIEVRDRVIPVANLKKRLNALGGEEGRQRIVILDLEQPFGVIVDDICKVLTLDASQYEVLPDAAVSDPDVNCTTHLVKTEEELIIVISPERILSRLEKEELDEFEKTNEGEDADVDSSKRAS